MTKNATAKAFAYHTWSDGTQRSKPEPPIHFPGAGVDWDTRTAAEAGMSQANIDSFVTGVGGTGILIRDGYQVASWGTQTTKFEWASAAKPVTATMMLFALQEALISSVDELVESHGWDLITKDETMTLLHLTNMVSGYYRAENPGTAWAYNDYAVQLFHETLFDNIFAEASPNTAALNANRLGALGFQDGSLYSSRNGYGVTTSPRDFARIGWFWLNKGNWDNVQLLPSALFDTHQQVQVAGSIPRTTADNGEVDPDYLGVGTYGGPSDQSELGPGVYGFGWWFNGLIAETATRLFPNAPTDLFMAQGHFGDETVVMIPSLGLVCACDSTGGWGELSLSNPTGMAEMDSHMAALAATVL